MIVMEIVRKNHSKQTPNQYVHINRLPFNILRRASMCSPIIWIIYYYRSTIWIRHKSNFTLNICWTWREFYWPSDQSDIEWQDELLLIKNHISNQRPQGNGYRGAYVFSYEKSRSNSLFPSYIVFEKKIILRKYSTALKQTQNQRFWFQPTLCGTSMNTILFFFFIFLHSSL